MFLLGVPYVVGGTTPALPAKAEVLVINPSTNKPSYAREAIIQNTGATNALKVFFTGVATPMTIAPNTSQRVNGPIHRVLVNAAAVTTTYEIVFSVA